MTNMTRLVYVHGPGAADRLGDATSQAGLEAPFSVNSFTAFPDRVSGHNTGITDAASIADVLLIDDALIAGSSPDALTAVMAFTEGDRKTKSALHLGQAGNNIIGLSLDSTNSAAGGVK